jgi:hypothetical protein
MELIEIPSEQTTAATDAILAVMSLFATLYLRRIGRGKPWKTSLWLWVFALLTLAAGLGAVAHGLKLSLAVQNALWVPLYLSLGLVVAFFSVAAVHDLWGETVARRALPFLLVIGTGFWALTLVWTDSFLLFVVYELLAMLFALGGYAWLTWHRRLEGAGWLAAGILVTIVAAGIQASGHLAVTLVWPFDHNGIYHLLQMMGVALLVLGLRTALLSANSCQ